MIGEKIKTFSVNPVREHSSLTSRDGGIEPPSLRNDLYHRQESVAFSNGVNRREFSKCVAGFAVAIAFNGIDAVLSSFANAELSMPEMRRFLNRNTVDYILQNEYDDGLIQKVEYNEEKGETNFDQLVFQKYLKANERKPVLVLFYGSPGDGDSAYEKREAIIMKELAKHYKKQVLFVAYDVWETKNIDGDLGDIWEVIIKNHTVNASPSIAMYSAFDLAKDETPQRNDGKIKQIDILRGGPDTTEEIIPKWLRFLRDKWIPTNLTSLNNTYAWRFKNSGKKHRAFYTIRVRRRFI